MFFDFVILFRFTSNGNGKAGGLEWGRDSVLGSSQGKVQSHGVLYI